MGEYRWLRTLGSGVELQRRSCVRARHVTDPVAGAASAAAG